MADKAHSDPKERGHEDEKITAKTAFLYDVLAALVGPFLAEILIKLAAALLKHRVEKSIEKDTEMPKHRVSYDEALLALRAEGQQGENAAEKIIDFLRKELTDTKDRLKFQERIAKIGGDSVEPSKQMLNLIAALPDHQSRREFVQMNNFIGEGSLDMMESAEVRVMNLAKSIVKILTPGQGSTVHFRKLIDSDTRRQRRILKGIEKSLREEGEVNTGILKGFVDSWESWRERRRKIWRVRWERYRQWRQHGHQYKLDKLHEKEETRRVKAAQPKRRWFFNLFHLRSR